MITKLSPISKGFHFNNVINYLFKPNFPTNFRTTNFFLVCSMLRTNVVWISESFILLSRYHDSYSPFFPQRWVYSTFFSYPFSGKYLFFFPFFLETLLLSAFSRSAAVREIMQHSEMGTFLADFPLESGWRFRVILHSIKHLQVFRQSVLSCQWASQATGLACCQSRCSLLQVHFSFWQIFFSKQRKQGYKIVSVIFKITDQTNIIPVLFVKLLKFHQNCKAIVEFLLKIEKS